MRLTPKRYALTLIAAGFALLGAVVAANVLIDPQRMFGTELFPDKRNANDRYLRYLAYRKAEPRIGGLVFASSRGSGIPLDVLSAHTGGVTYADFTVGFGMITDHLPVLERAIRDKASRGERLKYVFLLLDADFLGERPSTNRNPQTHLHPDLTGEDPIRFWIRYLTAIQFRAWRDDVRRAFLPKAARAALDRPAVQPPLPRVRLAALGNAMPLLPLPKEPMRVTARPDYQRQLALLRRFAELCRQHGTELVVATSPLHRTMIGYIDMQDRAAAVADVSRITPVWDFGAPPWLSDRGDLWADHSHFTAAVGRMMIERIFTGALPAGARPFGERRPAAGPAAGGR
jgi:hypothetical protein